MIMPRTALIVAPERHEEHHEEQRPEQVELLLHRQRPQVAQRRGPPAASKYDASWKDQVPVLDVGDRGEHLRPEAVELLVQESTEQRDDAEQEEQRRAADGGRGGA